MFVDFMPLRFYYGCNGESQFGATGNQNDAWMDHGFCEHFLDFDVYAENRMQIHSNDLHFIETYYYCYN